jgi:hypothetical protein
MRHILIHYHIFKNAGSTIDSILKRNFGERCGSIEGLNPWDTLSPSDILKYATENPSIEAISSHQARLPTPNYQNLAFHPLLFLRHPIDRAGSVYFFERRQPISSPSLGVKIAHEKDFAGYVKWRLTDGNGAVIRNFQTVHLAGRKNDMRFATAIDSDLKDAINKISELPFFGIVELFDDSIEKMKKYLSQYFNGINVNYSIENKSTGRGNTLQERLNDVEKMLGSNLYQELLAKNTLYMQLYDYAIRLFSSHVKE